LSVAQEIIGIVQETMTRHNLRRLETVVVRIGGLTGINPDALAFGFEMSIADTPLEGARLSIEQVPITVECRGCGRKSAVERFVFVCPQCNGTDLEVIGGKELDIDHLVGE